jgi:hypothetical protein
LMVSVNDWEREQSSPTPGAKRTTWKLDPDRRVRRAAARQAWAWSSFYFIS